MMKLTTTAAVLAGTIAVIGFSNTVAQPAYPVPPAWPAQHYHTEMMYTISFGSWSNKLFRYDFPNMRMRVDQTWTGGVNIPIVTPNNFSSYWIGDDLYMYTYDGNASCFHMNLGFGIPRPDWFTDGDQLNTTYLAKKSDGMDDTFHNTVWTRKCATCDSDPNGYFNYFSLVGGTGEDVAGTPFRLEAPGPTFLGYVINEYYDFKTANFTSDTIDFSLPQAPACTSVSLTSRVKALQANINTRESQTATAHEAAAFLASKGFLFHELYMALV